MKLDKELENILKQKGYKKVECPKEKKESKEQAPPEKWQWAGDLIQILLFYEIYKRRHDSHRGILRF